jgi:outer membrane protein
MSSARAAHLAARAQLKQQQAVVVNDELAIAQQVREAARQAQTNEKQIAAPRLALELARQTLDAEQERFRVGMSTSFLIVQRQRDLTQAEVNYVSVLIAYNEALVKIERARGRIPRDRGEWTSRR